MTGWLGGPCRGLAILGVTGFVGWAPAGCRAGVSEGAGVAAVEAGPKDGAASADEGSGEAEDASTVPYGPKVARAVSWMARRRPERALTELLDAEQHPEARAGEAAAATYLLGRLDLAQGRYEQAAARLARAAVLRPLAPIEDVVRVDLAEARLGAGDPSGALAVLDAPVGDALAGRAYLLRARARLRTGDPSGALADAEAAAAAGGVPVLEVEAVRALALAAEDTPEGLEAARRRWEAVLLGAPETKLGEKAARRLAELEARLGPARRGAKARAFSRRLALARARNLLDRRRYSKAHDLARKVLLDGGASPLTRCEAAYLAGTALFRMRRRVQARRWFRRAAQPCSKAGDAGWDLGVRSAYQAARGLYAGGKYAAAGRAFERLARRAGRHRLGDDAWLLAGESWEAAADPDRADAAYGAAASAGGDMADEATRRRVLLALSSGRVDRAREVAAAAARRPGRAGVGFAYLAARLLPEEAAKRRRVAFGEVLAADPWGYYGAQAYGRLVEMGATERAKQVLAAPARRPAPVAEDAGRAGLRATILARLGMGDLAAGVLAAAGIRGWTAARVLADAGAHAQAQRVVAGLSGDLAAAGAPQGPWRPWLEVAFPRPFEDRVREAAADAGVDPRLLLAFAQTESRFDPDAVSWAGARGLVQLMPKTARSVAASVGMEISEDDLFDPAVNLRLAARYVADLVDGFGGDGASVVLAVAGYNAGPGAVRRWLRARPGEPLDLFVERIPFDETRRYTKRVLGRYFAYCRLYGDAAEGLPHLPVARTEPPDAGEVDGE